MNGRLRIRHSFATVAEAFIKEKLSQERSGKASERDCSAKFVEAWADRPVSEITKLDVLEIINAKKPTAPKMAGAMLILIRRFFGWAVDQHVYGLTTRRATGWSGEDPRPAAVAHPTPHRHRDVRVLAGQRRMGYPVGPVYRLLLLTGLRLNEAANLAWSEVQGDTIVIPPERMKGKNGKAREHRVPLPSASQEILASLPRYRGGSICSATAPGRRP